MVVKITLVKNFHFHFLPLNLLCTKCAIFFGLTLTAPIIVMSPSGRTCDMYKIILQLKWKGNYKMWIVEHCLESLEENYQVDAINQRPAQFTSSLGNLKNVSPGSKEQ